jgi:adenosine deaminase
MHKVELHLHADCSLSESAVRALAPGTTADDYARLYRAPAVCTDLGEYLTYAQRSLALLQSEHALRLMVADLFEQLAADRVVYAELRFAPLFHLKDGLTPEAVTEIVANEMRRRVAEHKIEAGLILCTLRHFSAEQSLATARLVERFRSAGVVALDLAGDEARYPLDAHEPAFRYAAEHGLNRIAHAGEAAGAQSVREVLDRLAPQRLSHGVRAIEDEALVAELVARQIHLEVCPTCNVQTGVYPSLSAHTLDRLYRRGLNIGINTDTRTLTPVTLIEEYNRLQQTFGWGPAEFRAANLNALRASFASAEVKARLEALIEA